jgi:putative oxidoreductase
MLAATPLSKIHGRVQGQFHDSLSGDVAMHSSLRYAAPFGRILFALIFVASALGKFADWQSPLKMMADQGVPSPELLLPIAAGLELIGGLMVATGFQARVGGVLLILFLVPVTFFMHNFWQLEPGGERMNQMINFMKNVSITGGALLVVAFGSGACSVDNLLYRAPQKMVEQRG